MKVDIVEQVDLTPLNTLALPATSRHFATVDSLAALQWLLSIARERHWPLLLLGGGSNLLLRGDHPGLTLKMAFDEIRLHQQGDQLWVRAGAGVVWDRLVETVVAADWHGIENLSGIPGTVGAAPIQNIGAYGAELADCFDHLIAVDATSGAVHRFERDQCQFGYRDSLFKRNGQWIIVEVTLRLDRAMSPRSDHGAVQSELRARGITAPSVADLRRAVLAIRASKLPDPRQLPNAGSFFHNPVVSAAHHARLRRSHPDLVSHPLPSGDFKLAAGWLIERLGWKGVRQGPVGVHPQQALVLVNHGGATAAQLLALAGQISDQVRQLFGVTLTIEPVCVPPLPLPRLPHAALST